MMKLELISERSFTLVSQSIRISGRLHNKVTLCCPCVLSCCYKVQITARGQSGDAKPVSATQTSDQNGSTATVPGSCDFSGFSEIARKYTNIYIQKTTDALCLRPGDTCNTRELPRTHMAYHLNGQTIQVDGRLYEPAWQQVPWTQDFLDIRGSEYPAPRFETKVKVRWDDTTLYVGAYLQETDISAFINVTDGNVYQDNDFEMLLATDGTMHNYKQVLINAKGVASDFEFFSSAHDIDSTSWVFGKEWSAKAQTAVHLDGTLNVPGDIDRSWTLEWAIDFKQLFKHTQKERHDHIVNEVWFINFGRAEYHYTTVGNQYTKDTSRAEDWWSWQPCGAINLHLQSRWGLIQFKKDLTDANFDFQTWHVYKALFEVYEALRAYEGMNGKYTDQLEDLNVQPYLFSGACVQVPQVSFSGVYFNVTVVSSLSGRRATIDQSRYVFLQ